MCVYFATKPSPENNTEFVRQLVMANFSLMYPIYFSETYSSLMELVVSVGIVVLAAAVSSFRFFPLCCVRVCRRFSPTGFGMCTTHSAHRETEQTDI